MKFLLLLTAIYIAIMIYNKFKGNPINPDIPGWVMRDKLEGGEEWKKWKP